MKINLAENMLRFGVKNLKIESINKIETIMEQAEVEFQIPGTSITYVLNDSPKIQQSSASSRTLYLNISPTTMQPAQRSAVITFNSPARTNDTINKFHTAISYDGFILNSKNFDANTLTAIDLVYYIAMDLFNNGSQQSVNETMTALVFVRNEALKISNDTQDPITKQLVATLNGILKVCFSYGKMEYQQWLNSDRKDGGYIEDDMGAKMVYIAARLALGLKVDVAINK
jgi:hypothetical protein